MRFRLAFAPEGGLVSAPIRQFFRALPRRTARPLTLWQGCGRALRGARRGLVAFFLASSLLPGAAAAACSGVSLLEQMTPDERQGVEARAGDVPYAEGNLWRAERGGQQMTIVGTYHLDDARHAATLALLRGEMAAAGALLVEAGPKEEAALLKDMADDPSLMFITEGPTLLERLPRDTWRRFSQALEARGIPGFMAAKMQPWYAMMLLAIPPCQMEDVADISGPPPGLDGQLIDLAEEMSLPVRALEPHETIFRIFGALNEEQLMAMIESSLAMEGQSEDFAVTLADLYFAGRSRLIWELTRFHAYDQPGYSPAQVDQEMALMEDLMMVRRNRAWIPVIEEAAAGQSPLIVAFGALHLSGEEGVLTLLEKAGWRLTPIEAPIAATPGAVKPAPAAAPVPAAAPPGAAREEALPAAP